MIELSLVAPGLLGPWPESDHPGFPLPAARNLAGILAAGHREPADGDFHRIVAALHGVESGTTAEPPIASLSRLADGGGSDKRQWLRLDLVHLGVEQGSPRLGATREMEISAAESEALWQLLAPYFKEIGWRVEPLHRSRWYLPLEADEGLQMRSLNVAVTGHTQMPPPASPTAGQWLARLTEIQMLLHDTEVNHQRERRGKPTINALWPRGGDALPNEVGAAVTMVYSTDAVLAGLAAMSREEHRVELPRSFDNLIAETSSDTSVLVTFDDPGDALANEDPSRWSAAVEDLEQLWLTPALGAARSGRLRRLSLWPCNGWVHRISFTRAWLAPLKSGSLCRYL